MGNHGGRLRLTGTRGAALERFWHGETDAAHALAEERGHATPATLGASLVLLDLRRDLIDCANDLGQQARAPFDQAEVLAKIDGITERVAEARAAYLASIE